MMVDVCTDGVVMMVMGKTKNDIMTSYAGSNILGKQKPFAGLFGNWLCLS